MTQFHLNKTMSFNYVLTKMTCFVSKKRCFGQRQVKKKLDDTFNYYPLSPTFNKKNDSFDVIFKP
jgi:hypothetical protein